MSERWCDFDSDPPYIWQLFATLEGRLAFDVGANGGATARKLSDGFAKVVAFEPAAESYTHLERDLPANVTAVPMALSDAAGPLDLVETDGAGALGELVSDVEPLAAWGERTGSRTVDAWTLDRAANLLGTPDFVKIDTEGHELPIVNGGVEVFGTQPRFLIEVHNEQQGDQLQQLLDAVVVRHVYRKDGWHWRNHYYLLDPQTARMVPGDDDVERRKLRARGPNGELL